MTDILVIQLAHLGDFLQTTPLLAALKSFDPERKLTVLVSSAQGDLARKYDLVDEVIEIDLAELKKQALPQDRLSQALLNLKRSLGFLARRKFDRIINLNTSRVAALIGALPSAGRREGPRIGTDRSQLLTSPWASFIMNLMPRRRLLRFNLVDLWNSFAESGNKPAGGLLYPMNHGRRSAARALLGSKIRGPLVGLQLGSRNEARQWPAANFAALAAGLMEKERGRIILLGALSENDLGRTVMTELAAMCPDRGPDVINLIGRTSLDELAGVLAELDLLVTTDTGVMHLAAALKKQILALFMGPAWVHETGPYGPGHVILQAGPDCSPCLENRPCDHNYRCRKLISPEMALAAAGWVLNPIPAHLPSPGSLGEEVRLYISDLDRFGVKYRPLAPVRLDRREILALACREAGRTYIRPSYHGNLDALCRELAGYRPPEVTTLLELTGDQVALEAMTARPGLAACGRPPTNDPDQAALARLINGLIQGGETQAAAGFAANVIQVLKLVNQTCAESRVGDYFPGLARSLVTHHGGTY
ncbi:MAG: glycosyltransferase family 9 protein [Thermodesulfobacteriota bacterium]